MRPQLMFKTEKECLDDYHNNWKQGQADALVELDKEHHEPHLHTMRKKPMKRTGWTPASFGAAPTQKEQQNTPKNAAPKTIETFQHRK